MNKNRPVPPAGFTEEDIKKAEALAERLRKECPPLSPAGWQVVTRVIELLNRPTNAGAERRALFKILSEHEEVPGTVLYQRCGKRVEARIRELQKAGLDIRRHRFQRLDGYSEWSYSIPGWRQRQARLLLQESDEKLPSLKRVM